MVPWTRWCTPFLCMCSFLETAARLHGVGVFSFNRLPCDFSSHWARQRCKWSPARTSHYFVLCWSQMLFQREFTYFCCLVFNRTTSFPRRIHWDPMAPSCFNNKSHAYPKRQWRINRKQYAWECQGLGTEGQTFVFNLIIPFVICSVYICRRHSISKTSSRPKIWWSLHCNIHCHGIFASHLYKKRMRTFFF